MSNSPEETSLTITPAIVEAIVKPGETTSQLFELRNNLSRPLAVKSYLRVFDAADEWGGITIEETPDERRLAVTSWSQLSETNYILPPNSTKSVTAFFSPPPDLPAGGYYATLLFEPLVPESWAAEISSLQIGGRVGALLYLIGPGDIKEQASITQLSRVTPWWSSELLFKLRLTNDGNTHLRPSGKMTLTSLIGGFSSSVIVNEFTILPNKSRYQQILMPNPTLLGVYNLSADMVAGSDKIVLSGNVTVIYLPWWQACLVGILLLIVLSVSIKSWRRRWRLFFKQLIIGSKG